MSTQEHRQMGEDGRWDWENETTLVDERLKFGARMSRFLRRLFPWAVVAGLVFWALSDPVIMNILRTIGGGLLYIAVIAFIFLSQFIVLFWFLSRSRMYTIMPGAEGVSFDDYRGQPELLEQAKQVVTLLRGVKAFEDSGGEPLNGLLLEGPPGTGKTWLAQAISTEAGVPFYYVDTSSLQAMFLGVGAFKVSRVYNKARKAAKEYGAAVIFLDEIDSIGSRSGVSAVGGGQNNPMGGMFGGGGSMGLLSTMLIEMSGFSLEHGWRARLKSWWYKKVLRRKPPKPQKRVLTIGATNRIQALDPALLRPGRFDKKVRVDVPDLEGRRDIIAYYLSKMSHDESMDPQILAMETPGYTPADIKYLLNETLRYALFAGRTYMTYRDFQLAQPEHEMGLRSPVKHMSAEARRRLAYYEAGYATAVRLFLPNHRISRITIVRQGMSFGHTSHFSARENYQGMPTKDDLINRLRVAVAGKAAEIEFLGYDNQTMRNRMVRSRAYDMGGDFGRIRYLLRLMAGAGLLGPLGAALGGSSNAKTPYRETHEMSEAKEQAFQQALVVTRQALREHAEVVNGLVEMLMEKDELLSEEIKAYFEKHGLMTPDPSYIRDGIELGLEKRPDGPRLTEGTAADAAPGAAD